MLEQQQPHTFISVRINLFKLTWYMGKNKVTV
ncbi:Uncharacterised protein [Klebsiella pneumoniae]|nr:Uncharacterised protein [Klebsiella pneumoniae]SVL75150.1 Uncharacterised protein [Klebsiella pneumoniae]SWM06537.1 Uncharacterised protein [Klebsiella pneumoniae]VGP64786.1 hypothetical protein SB01124_05307 [Klebsiella quasipneumoniae subsp. quasipneumoniae]